MPGEPSPGTENLALRFEPCGLVRRFLVILYDGLVVIGLLMLAAAVALILGTGNQVAGKDFLYTLYLITVWFLYLSWCWRHGGMTMGMRAWHVKLITDDGIRLSWAQCFIRFFGSWVSAILLGAGFVWALSDKARRCWHDRLSKTRLIRVEKTA